MLEAENKLKHELCPYKAQSHRARTFDFSGECPREELHMTSLHQFLISLYGEYFIPGATTSKLAVTAVCSPCSEQPKCWLSLSGSGVCVRLPSWATTWLQWSSGHLYFNGHWSKSLCNMQPISMKHAAHFKDMYVKSTQTSSVLLQMLLFLLRDSLPTWAPAAENPYEQDMTIKLFDIEP